MSTRARAARPAINTVAPVAEQASSKAINTQITAVRTAFGKINNLVQSAALAVMVHAQQYGDCTGAARLLDAMPKSSRRGLVQTFFQRYSPIAVHLDTKTGKMKAHLRNTESKAYSPFNIEAARANPWYAMPEADKEPEILTLEDFKSSAERFVARMKKMAEDTEHVAKADRKVVGETVKKLEAMLTVFESDEPLKF